MNIFKVILSKQAKYDLLRTNVHIVRKFQAWVDNVEYAGLYEVRKIPDYHDEPLKGKRLGQRSVRLNRSYRAIYEIDKEGKIEIVRVLEINNHEY